MSKEASPSKMRAGVKPMSLAALSGDFTAPDDEPGNLNSNSSNNAPSSKAKRTPPPEPVGNVSSSPETDQLQTAGPAAPAPAGAGGGIPPPVPTYGYFPMPGPTTQQVKSPGSMSNGGGMGGLTPPMPAGTPTHMGHPMHHGGSSQQHHNLPSPSGLTESEYLHTRNLIPHVQQRALVAVMQSLIDDFPTLTPVIRIRCEKAMAFVMHQQTNQQRSDGGGVQSQQGAGSQHNSNAPTPQHYRGGSTPPQENMHPGITPPGSATKAAAKHRLNATGGNSGNRREQEEQERCGVHGNMRAAKHLSYNLQSQRWECIPGFHCLVQASDPNRLSSPPPAPIFPGGAASAGVGGGGSGSRRDSRSASHSATPNDGNTPIPGASPMKQPPGGLAARRGSSTPMLGGDVPPTNTTLASNNNHRHDSSSNNPNGTSTGGENPKAGGVSPTSPQMDVDRLTSLLDELNTK